MNVKTLIATALITLGSASTFAMEATEFGIDAPVLTRAEVRAELARAIAAGELSVPGESYGSFVASTRQPSGPGLTRDAVVAELQRARANGELELRGEAYGSFHPSAIVSTRTRAEVLAEVRANGMSRSNYRDYTGG